MDSRIGPKFLKASVGFGGSCFQKDILNLVYLCEFYGLDEVAEYWHQIVKINDYQKKRFAQKIIDHFNGNLIGKKIAILGWAFKANTNDTRESAAIYVADYIIKNNGEISVYDPMVNENQILNDLELLWDLQGLTKQEIEEFQKKITFNKTISSSVIDSDSVGILTEWEEFSKYDWDLFFNSSKESFKIFDGRNILKGKFKNNRIAFLG
jgi:UDPglucose 6-dehydrogenase